ncbi:MAG TPA: PLP-dependent aminotransferase family protein [Opitutaceae bacterium]|nr:PLP-dependent aminotransferase family protein [Opitutaceae bacterium]
MSATPPISFSALGRRAAPPIIARLMTAALENSQLLSLAAGFTDNATLPVEPFGAAVAALTAAGGSSEPLQYGTNQGRPGLRRLLAERLAHEEGWPADRVNPARVLVTNGSQQALYLAMQALCDPGDIVLVDRPSYFVFLEMLRGLGVEARSLPVGVDGRLDLPALDALLAGMGRDGSARRVKAVYVIGYFANPSGRSLDTEEKRGLARTLTAHGLVVPTIEDAAYRQMAFDGAAGAPSLLALPEWDAFPKLYAGTLTKPFATGLKVGYGICTAPEWLARMLHVKGHHDFGSANLNQAVLERVLADGTFDAHLARIRPAYERKMQVLHGALVEGGLAARGWSWPQPRGGLYLWLTAPAGMDLGIDSAFYRACVAGGVLYVPGELCYGDAAAKNTARLTFGVLAEAELREAARRFCAVAVDGGRWTVDGGRWTVGGGRHC